MALKLFHGLKIWCNEVPGTWNKYWKALRISSLSLWVFPVYSVLLRFEMDIRTKTLYVRYSVAFWCQFAWDVWSVQLLYDTNGKKNANRHWFKRNRATTGKGTNMNNEHYAWKMPPNDNSQWSLWNWLEWTLFPVYLIIVL